MEDITYRQAFAIGIFQCIALIWPGFSRSASTIIGGWIVGLSTIASAEFIISFIVALVVVGRFINYLKNKPMKVFANCRIKVGLVIVVLAFINIL